MTSVASDNDGDVYDSDDDVNENRLHYSSSGMKDYPRNSSSGIRHPNQRTAALSSSSSSADRRLPLRLRTPRAASQQSNSPYRPSGRIHQCANRNGSDDKPRVAGFPKNFARISSSNKTAASPAESSSSSEESHENGSSMPAANQRSASSFGRRLSRRSAAKSEKTKIPLLPSPPLWSRATSNTHRSTSDPGYAANMVNTSPPSGSSSPLNASTPAAAQPVLHRVIAQANTMEDLWNPSVRELVTPNRAAAHDAVGQTPFHVLSENVRLSDALLLQQQQQAADDRDNDNGDEYSARGDGNENDDFWIQPSSSGLQSRGGKSAGERQLIHFGLHLFKAHPAGMITHDRFGFIPFEKSLTEWVVHIHRDYVLSRGERDDTTMDLLHMQLPSFIQSHWSSSHTQQQSRYLDPTNNNNNSHGIATSSSSGADVEEEGIKGSIHMDQADEELAAKRARLFPDTVALTAHAHYAIIMLSTILDHLDRRIETKHDSALKHNKNGPRTQESRKHLIGKESDDGNSLLRTMEKFKSMTLVDVRAEIIRSIASIPNFVKTVLIIQDESEREFCMQSTLMQCVLASQYSIGPWLPGMLQSQKACVVGIAIEYLRDISEKISYSSASAGRKWGDSSTRKLVARHSKQTEDVASTTADLSEEVSKLDDFVPSLLSLGESDLEDAATTKLVRKVLDRIVSRPFAVTTIFCDALFLGLLIFGFRGAVSRLLLGGSTNSILRHIYLANTGIFFFVIREIGKAVSLCMVSRRARIYFLSFWNWTDLISTALALASSVGIRWALQPNTTDIHGLGNLRTLLAATTGFLWLRVLNFLKGINMQLATFVLAILQITRDITWFCVILLTLVVSFAQIFFTLLSPNTCANQPDDGNNSVQQCNQSEYYLKVYAILLGDFGTFEREDFTSVVSVVLIVGYSFMVVLVLMNVLIAIASDSYEKCLIRSHKLFGRARVMMVAESVAFQNLLRRQLPATTDSSSMMTNVPGYKVGLSRRSLCVGWSRGSLVFLILSAAVVASWAVSETAGFALGFQEGSGWMNGCSILVTVLLYTSIVIFLDIGASRLSSPDRHSESSASRFETIFQSTMLRLLGSTKESDGIATENDRDGWQGRLVFLRDEMQQISNAAQSATEDKLAELGSFVTLTESRLQEDITRIETSLGEIKGFARSCELQETIATLKSLLREVDR